MAARERERPRSAQPAGEDSDNEGDVDGPSESTVSSKIYAAVCVLPGILLYVYMLYIVLANLLYPSSLAPFIRSNSSSNSINISSGTKTTVHK